MNVILLQHDHTHVSATHVAIFRVVENKNTDIIKRCPNQSIVKNSTVFVKIHR